jgi:hypothetical protein
LDVVHAATRNRIIGLTHATLDCPPSTVDDFHRAGRWTIAVTFGRTTSLGQTGKTFTVEVKEGCSQMNSPTVGMMLPVLCDPKDQSKVVVDHDDGAGLEVGLAV